MGSPSVRSNDAFFSPFLSLSLSRALAGTSPEALRSRVDPHSLRKVKRVWVEKDADDCQTSMVSA